MIYIEKLAVAIDNSQSCLCVGLDPNTDKIPEPVKRKFDTPEQQVLHFLKKVIEVTSDHCAAYKPNLAFFEALGKNGLNIFSEVLSYIPGDKIVIADAKRGDIGSTAKHYARAYFDVFNVDALTINPLMGFETLEPFMPYPGKAIYVLTLTSNPGAGDFLLQPVGNHRTAANYIADTLSKMHSDKTTNPGMVVGATKIEDIKDISRIYNYASLLIPGIGTQGGSIEELKGVLDGHFGTPLVNSSRSILYAGGNEPDWHKKVSEQAKLYKDKLQPITKRYVAQS